ncbi:MAG: hypothetical protein GYB35_09265 [Algicola sp.]|nr:hypothetical protein [Algicola sp.]
MKKFYWCLLLILIPMIFFSQEKESFKLDDVIFLKENTGDKVDSFLKSRFFEFVKINEEHQAYEYGLNYNRNTKKATIWVVKEFEGDVSIVESGEGLLLKYIKEELENYKEDFEYQENSWTMSTFYYETYEILIRENNVLEEYMLFIQDRI